MKKPVPDFLIVGAGSAGCVLANRLSAAGAKVLLMEAGADTPPGAVPPDVADVYPRSYYNGAYMWPELTAEQGGDLSGVKTPFPQARIMGGGSSVMGMIALRGRPEDYDGWNEGGAEGWGWEDVVPYFRRLEADWDFAEPLHGRDGPVTIRRHRQSDWPPFSRAVGEACNRRGFATVEDMNADFRDGYCPLPLSCTLTSRVSAASAYLDAEVRRRPNLTIQCESTVQRLIFQDSRCVGVSVLRNNRMEEQRAGHVIVSSGAIHSPALLLRSGIGSTAALEPLGIPMVCDLPGVGANLQNHPVVYLATHIKPEARQSPLLRPQFNSGLRFSSGSDPAMRGDLLMLVVNKSSWHGLGHAVAGLGVCLMQPFSRGSVTLTSRSPLDPPDVRFRMLTDERDHARMVGGLALAVDLVQDEDVRPLRHEVFAAGYSAVVRQLNKPGIRNVATTKLLAALLDGPDRLRQPMIKRGIARGDIDELQMRKPSWQAQTVRSRSFGTYHPAGTCRMGPSSERDAVVSPTCAVHGIDGLSVVDASIMPRVVRANTNIPVIMLAERAADRIAGRPAARDPALHRADS